MNNQDQDKVSIGVGGVSLNAMADKMATIKKAIQVAKQVRAKLNELGWTKKQLANAMGCSQPMVTKIMRGDQNLTLETISKLERVLGIKEIYLHKQEEPNLKLSDAQLASFNFGWSQDLPEIPITGKLINSFHNINNLSHGRKQTLA